MEPILPLDGSYVFKILCEFSEVSMMVKFFIGKTVFPAAATITLSFFAAP